MTSMRLPGNGSDRSSPLTATLPRAESPPESSAWSKGSRGNAWLSSSQAAQKTWHPAAAASGIAVRTSADLPMPASPSMSTAPSAARRASPATHSRRSARWGSRPIGDASGDWSAIDHSLAPTECLNRTVTTM